MRNMQSGRFFFFPFKFFKILWVETANQYILLSDVAVDILSEHIETAHICEITHLFIEEETSINENLGQLLKFIRDQIKVEVQESVTYSRDVLPESDSLGFIARYYSYKTKTVKVLYSSESVCDLIHPKFEHLESQSVSTISSTIELIEDSLSYAISVDNRFHSSWLKSESHFFLGKVSMTFLNAIYDKEDKDWLAVFHAAGVSNGSEVIMFAGECGSGKSTVSALLNLRGYDILADDFLPMTNDELFHHYPAGVKIKGELLFDHFRI